MQHRREAVRRTIDTSPVAAACLKFVATGRSYDGTVAGLLATLTPEDVERYQFWPRSPRGLADAIRRAAPALRQLGVEITIESKPRRDGVHCHLARGTYEATRDASPDLPDFLKKLPDGPFLPEAIKGEPSSQRSPASQTM